MENEVINTLQDGIPVTSTYADIYFDDNYCDNKQSVPNSSKAKVKKAKTRLEKDEASPWVSPSDLLIGVVELIAPFTSKITRGKTHEGLLAIGNDILAVERANFMRYLTNLVQENDAAWNHILTYEKAAVARKVKVMYEKIFTDKSKIMTQEISTFYEETLRDLEINIKTQLENILMSSHASIVNKLNIDIKEKLKTEKEILDNALNKTFQSQVVKLKSYYSLLLRNESLRGKQLINKAIVERNDVIQAFMRQIEAENTSSTMYVLSTERKKCRIEQFILNNYQSQELKENYEKLKQRQDIIDSYKKKELHIVQLNREWEAKIKNILQIFLKFISFSLKLLPEQTSFLLNFEKMVVLQLNELQKMPNSQISILVDAEALDDTFEFERLEVEVKKCTKEPFILTGGYLSGTPSTQYGSRETLPDDADLPVVRLQRQFVYAKCHGYEEIKARLEAERCKCMDIQTLKPPSEPEPSSSVASQKSAVQASKVPSTSVSESLESLTIDDNHRFETCPVRGCQDWLNKSPFPYLDAYLDFDEEKYERVLAILGKQDDNTEVPTFIDPKDIIYRELPFGPTKELYNTVETQYSSEEDLLPDFRCPCLDYDGPAKQPSTVKLTETASKVIMDNMAKRKKSLGRLLSQNPRLMKFFTDEFFDLIL